MLFQSWPVRWGYTMLVVCALLGFGVVQFRVPWPKWMVFVPVAWFGWQILATPSSIAPNLTQPTLIHFGACLFCFGLGLFGLGGLKRPGVFWVPLLFAFLFVLWMGFEQHYGGLEATRKAFYEQPDWQKFPPEYLKRIASNRIFSTLVYPNALAGAILLLLPVSLVTTWQVTHWLTRITRAVLVGLVAYAALACLYWSGSKSGWLIGLVLVATLALSQPVSRRLKTALITGLLVLGLAGFLVKFAGYFSRGAPSVSARFEYWRAALWTAKENPVFGTGPGTFSQAYRKIKPPEAEMAQLVHNDYLEQASDSGVLGLVTYSVFVFGLLWLLAPSSLQAGKPAQLAVWLGLLGWSLQSFVEFVLYIPGLTWPAFTFLGWLWAKVGTPAFEKQRSQGSAASL
jgi:O-antigen ligase